MDSRGGSSGRGDFLPVAALGFLLLVSVVWWATALWPLPASAPAWLQSARAICFGARHDGLPDAGGWILLVGEPLGMTAALYLIWRESLMSGLRRLASRWVGRATLGAAGVVLLVGVGGASWRIASARGAGQDVRLAARPAPAAVRAIDRPPPPLRLLDQYGDSLTLERFLGRPVVVSFAYSHCETVCPLLVHEALDARRSLGEAAPAVVLVTLDPWRDTPSRLPHIASAWGLDGAAFVAGGSVEAVRMVLDDWGIGIARDLRTGEITHTPATFLIDARGRMAYQTTGSADELVRLVRTLQ